MIPGARLAVATTALLALATPTEADASPLDGPTLAARLAEEWRWREHPLERADLVPHSVVPFDDASVLLLSNVGVARFDGRRTEVPRGWNLGGTAGEAAARPDGVVVRLRGALAFLDERGMRWREPANPSVEQQLAHLIVRKDGTVCVADGDTIVAVTAEGRRPFLDGPAPGAKVGALAEDRLGRLWVATEEGIHRRDGDRWTRVPIPEGLRPRTLGRARAAGDRVHFLPVAEDRGVMAVTWDGAALRRLDAAEVDVATEPAVAFDCLVSATWMGRILVLDGDAWLSAEPPLLRGERIRSLAWLSTGRLVVVTARGRLLSCDVSSERWREHRAAESGPWCVVNAITPHPDGGHWIGTSGGLLRFRDGAYVAAAERDALDGLQAITALATDDAGGLWIGSGSGFRGARRLAEDGTVEVHREPEGIGDAFVHAIRRGHDGSLWFALLDNFRDPETAGGLARLRDGAWTRFGVEDGLPVRRCYDVLDSPRWTLAATASGAAEWRDGAWRDFGVGPEPVRVFRLFETRAGDLWAGPGLGNRGLHVLADGVFTPVEGGAARLGATDFAETSDRRLWVAGEHGLAVVDGDFATHPVGEEPGAPVARSWPILADADDTLWIGSLGHGLIRHRPDDEDPPEVLSIALTPTEHGVAVRLRGRDPWDVTPAQQLRYRLRVGKGPWGEARASADALLPPLEDGTIVHAQAIDLAGNGSAAPTSAPFRRPPDAFARYRTAGLVAIFTLIGLVLLLQLRRVHERREAKERVRARLSESERRYRSLVESAEAVLCSYDERGAPTYVSPRLAEICGVPPATLDASTLAARIHPDDLPALERQAELRARGEADPNGVEFRVKDATGGWRWFWQVQSRRQDDDGSPRGFDTVAVDVTERRRLQEALDQTRRLESLGVLAGGVAHDFNNLLVGVLGNAELLRPRIAADPETSRLLDRIERAGREAGTLCRRMLAYAGRAQIDDAVVDLNAVVRAARSLFERSVPPRVDVVVRLEEDEPLWIFGDGVQLQQVVLNLVANAGEAIGDRAGTVVVRTSASKAGAGDRPSWFSVGNFEASTGAAVLEVSDDGAGLDEADVPRIFEPFFTTKFEGRGLGLAAVAGIVRAHRGAIDVRSSLGAGATFRVWLPAAPAPELDAAAGVRPPERRRLAGRILLIDDDPAVVGVARAMLEDLGLETVVADGGRSGLERWRSERDRIDAVLLDVTMPDVDGIDVLKEMRRVDPGVRVILTTGYAREDLEQRCVGVRPYGFLAKPYSYSDLEREILKVLDRDERSRGTR